MERTLTYTTNNLIPPAGQTLHAWKLSFYHPIAGEKMQFTALLSEDMAKVSGSSLPVQ